jgi:hypothetical protein
VIPALLLLLAALTVIPVGQALLELIVRPVTVAELVDRRVGLSTQLVAVDGYALVVPFHADAPLSDAASSSSFVYHWYAVRDSLQERRLVLVRSIIAADSLRTRTVVARIVDDPGTVSGTLAGIAARGGISREPALASSLLVEVDPGQASVREIGSLAELGELPTGVLVRLTLRFDAGIASCVMREGCRARRLAAGIGSWDNLATDASGARRVVVRTLYPPSVAPFHGVGHHAQDTEMVLSVLAQPAERALLGWGRVLFVAHVEHDLGLPIDHLWLGPILFTAFGALVTAGLLLGYPRFHVTDASRRRWPGSRVDGPGVVHAVASGRVTPPNTSPIAFAGSEATLRIEPPHEQVRLTLALDGGPVSVVVPRALDGLQVLEVGEEVRVTGRRPALRFGWFGSQAILLFADTASRDRAAAMMRAG